MFTTMNYTSSNNHTSHELHKLQQSQVEQTTKRYELTTVSHTSNNNHDLGMYLAVSKNIPQAVLSVCLRVQSFLGTCCMYTAL